MDYKSFSIECKAIAEECGCMVEVRNYEQYGWHCAAFMVDKFGGIACQIKCINGIYKLDSCPCKVHTEDFEVVAMCVPAMVEREKAVRSGIEMYNCD